MFELLQKWNHLEFNSRNFEFNSRNSKGCYGFCYCLHLWERSERSIKLKPCFHACLHNSCSSISVKTALESISALYQRKDISYFRQITSHPKQMKFVFSKANLVSFFPPRMLLAANNQASGTKFIFTEHSCLWNGFSWPFFAWVFLWRGFSVIRHQNQICYSALTPEYSCIICLQIPI